MKFSVLRSNEIKSPLEQIAVVRPKANKAARVITTTLLLTSLVDAFSILVIYLLINSSDAQKRLDLHKDIDLPTAAHSALLKEGVEVKIVKDGYIVNNIKVNSSQLFSTLSKFEKDYEQNDIDTEKSIIIQADKNIDFDRVSPLITMASEAGYENIKFATLGGGS